MISSLQAQQIHTILIDRFGGSHGIRDENLLVSALNRPYQTFDGKDLYSTPFQKAAALIESVLVNHPFTDGNKRTGYVLMRLLLIEAGYDIKATEEEKYTFVIRIAAGKSNFNDIVFWLEHFTIKKIGG